jgi:diaminopimelate epimerase
MIVHFSKYQGTGNDFIMLDNLSGTYNDLSVEMIQFLCDRRFGIGGDGLIKINSHETADFEMDYYNSDGSKSFCGNGARCSVVYAETLGVDISNTTFSAIDGLHHASRIGEVISLQMKDVSKISCRGKDFVIHTGSPHYVRFTNDIDSVDIVDFGKEIRFSPEFSTEGINVNLVQVTSDKCLIVNTYERGVEDETLSCGTGVTACALAYGFQNNLLGKQLINIKVKGGELKVSFVQKKKGEFCDIQLIGPGKFVFSGDVNV